MILKDSDLPETVVISLGEVGTFEFGANSHTAWGDGSAPLFYRTNDKGEVIEAVYHYDTHEDEE